MPLSRKQPPAAGVGDESDTDELGTVAAGEPDQARPQPVARQITSGPYDALSAVFSPDGLRVAFYSNRTSVPDMNDDTNIFVVAADSTDKGQTIVQVTDGQLHGGRMHGGGRSSTSPAWSPDGELLAYTTQHDLPTCSWYATRVRRRIHTGVGTPISPAVATHWPVLVFLPVLT